MKQLMMTVVCGLSINILWAQHDTASNITKKERLDFAKTYFEYGVIYTPSFTGKKLVEGDELPFEHAGSFNQYLTWGAFHFWGHTEFYVTFPLGQLDTDKNAVPTYELSYSVVTGARVYPWAMEEKKIRPYVGLNWGTSDFKQILYPEDHQPTLSKDFLLNYESGVVYNYKSLALRLSFNYYPHTKWDYPISKTQKAEVKTPPLIAQVGLLYTYESSKNTRKENIDRWNSYPRVSKLSHDAKKFGDVFIGAGPSLSFSLKESDYNKSELPYLKDKLTSTLYFDVAIGYHFNRANVFTALSFRNPKFETEGYGSKQTIQKTSIALEVNKFLTDYSGFAPYIGINVAYDKLTYHEEVDNVRRDLTNNQMIEPGITFGWDIVPGKTNEVLILRTNLRWYPFSTFAIDGYDFNFNQLEYNLIQAVFYPDRLRRRDRSER